MSSFVGPTRATEDFNARIYLHEIGWFRGGIEGLINLLFRNWTITTSGLTENFTKVEGNHYRTRTLLSISCSRDKQKVTYNATHYLPYIHSISD